MNTSSNSKIIKENTVFLLPHLLVLLVVGPILMLTSKNELHLQITSFHHPVLDQFFKIITFAGDGAFPFIVGGILAFFSFRKAILVALGCSLAGLLAQFFKRAVFPDIKRPLGVFDQELLHLIPGVDLHTAYSFPSGHTTTVFSLAICLAIFSKNKTMKALWLLFALVTGFSRVYLSQHFLVDVYFGSILGVVTMLIIFRPFQRLKWEWLNKSVITLFKTPQNNK